MAYSNIKQPNLYFNTKLYTGNGSSGHAITGVEHQPDLTWIKQRSGAEWHTLIDSVRGVTKYINSNDAAAERTSSNFIESFDSNGFTLGSANDTNQNSQTYASWNFKANGTGVANTNGDIASTVSANTTSGFSIVSYTGTGANATVGHGLGVAPAFVIIKDRGNALSWVVSGDNIGWNKNMYLNSTQAVQTGNHFQDTAPTSSFMYLSTDAAVNGSSRNYIMYCFAEKQGFSKFGSYVGNGSTDGTFVYTGFKPAFVMSKRTDATDGWRMMDATRSSYNVAQHRLLANASDTEVVGTAQGKDFLSNGFKIRTSDSGYNTSGATYIYMAFAEQPLVGDNPATAR